MNKKLIFLNCVVILCLLLSACGSSLSIQVPAPDGSNSGTPAQGSFDNTLIYFLVGAVVVIALIAVLGGRRSP
jgi:hypothetical protein